MIKRKFRYLSIIAMFLFLAGCATTTVQQTDDISLLGESEGIVFGVINTEYHLEEDKQLRIAFDFDGVIASDEAEIVYRDTGNLDLFHGGLADARTTTGKEPDLSLESIHGTSGTTSGEFDIDPLALPQRLRRNQAKSPTTIRDMSRNVV